MSKHTDLPWTLGNGEVRIRTEKDKDGRSRLIAECYTTNNGVRYPSYEERKANARFIVKAVNSHYELLEALEALVDFHIIAYGLDGAWDEQLNKAQKAIAKAKGGTQ